MNRIPAQKIILKKNKSGLKKVKLSLSPKAPILKVVKPAPVVGRKTFDGDASFVRALVCPFAESALGSKVPDMFRFPTTSYHLKTTLLCAAQSSGSLVFFSNPLHTLWDNGLVDASVASVGGAGGFIRHTNTITYGATSSSILAGLCTDWRVVSSGIRVRNLMPELSATGRIFVASVPLAAGGTPNLSILNTISTTDARSYLVPSSCSRLGLPTPAIMDSPAIQELPTSRDYVVGQLLGEESLYVNHQVFHPDFYRFKPAVDQSAVSATTFEADDVVFSAASGLVSSFQSGNKEMTQSDGSSAIVFYWEGTPASTVPFEIDFVMHLELTPKISTQSTSSNTVGLTPVPDHPPQSYPGSTALVEGAINVANSVDSVINLATEAKNSVQSVDRMLGGALTSIGKGALSILPGGIGKKLGRLFGL